MCKLKSILQVDIPVSLFKSLDFADSDALNPDLCKAKLAFLDDHVRAKLYTCRN